MLPLDGFIVQNLIDWIKALKDALSDIDRRNRKAIVIAISRKMPRMFEWLKVQDDKRLTDILTPEFESVESFVDSLNLTTEYALPFLFSKCSDEVEYDVVVVDDIIIHGSTLRQVSSDICALTGKKPIASTIFKCENVGRFPYADTSIIDNIKPLNPWEAEEANRFIARAILETSLPMDMVFPIFHVSNEFANKFSEDLCKNKDLSDFSYSIPREGFEIPSESILIKTDTSSFYLNDFAKCRIFRKGNSEAEIVVYAPVIFRTDSVVSKEPFDNQTFLGIWSHVKGHIQKIDYKEVQSRMNDKIYSYAADSSLRERIALSLAAVANYLVSLSLMNHLLQQTNLLSKINSFNAIRKKDLQLILGKDLTDGIYGQIVQVIGSTMKLSPIKEDLRMPPFICPMSHSEKYDEYRKYIAQKNKSIDSALNGVFDLQRDPRKIGLKISPDKSPETAGIAESFQSMMDLLARFVPESTDIRLGVNKYIDEKIDEGAVSSFYAITQTPGKTSCIKRYLRAGSNSLI